MNSHIAAVLASERQRELELAAECCTPAAEFRRARRRPLSARLLARWGKSRIGGRARRAAPTRR